MTAGALNEQSAVRVLEIEGTRFTYVVDGALDMVRGKFFPGIPETYWTEHPEALDAKGRVAVFFPAATYLVAADEGAPHGRGEAIPGAPGRSEVIEPIASTHEVIADGDEIFPGVRARRASPWRPKPCCPHRAWWGTEAAPPVGVSPWTGCGAGAINGLLHTAYNIQSSG
ncbi:hypothetical protein ACWEOE_30950 [Amycolatopsis sp. NPDC004368]